ncbi:MAG TPA: argininosuccinate lyase [Myxococcaceae bacterium]|nr:argininosuccinate lyase [Myxococcaceae bacterium]
MTLARSDATGLGSLSPEVLSFTSSLPVDIALFAADIVGSLAHVRMLEESGLIPSADAAAIRRGLKALYDEALAGKLVWPQEEDVHMSIEAELGRRIGEAAKRLHTARSRNDQIALDARLYLREQTVMVLERLTALLDELIARAEGPDGKLLMPAYTHRQRAQPISVAYLLSAYAQMLARDAAQFAQVLNALDDCPLGVGAVSGTSLPIRRERTAEMLAFSRVTENGLDTVGDRDFALDFTYAAAKCLSHLSRISQDVVDFSSQEFGFIQLDDRISFGSSMMPQKRNPDLFELIRGKSARGIAAHSALFTVLKGLPVGYMRDLQEDKVSYLESAGLIVQCLEAMIHGIRGIRFAADRMSAGLAGGGTQATDLAERLVSRGVPFRDAYRAVGKLVQAARSDGKALSDVGAAELSAAEGLVTEADLAVLSPAKAVEAKETPGGTGPQSVAAQLEELREAVAGARARITSTPRLAEMVAQLAS